MVARLVLTVLFTVALAPAAQAACTNNYTGANGGEWQTNANWSAGHIPIAAEDVCVPAGKSVVIIENGNANANTVTIAAGATVTMRTDPGFSATQAFFGDVDNAGTFEFVATGLTTDNDQNNLWIARKFVNRGLLRAAQSEGTTLFTGDVENTSTGSIAVAGTLIVHGNQAKATWTNAGAVTIAAGKLLSLDSGLGTEFRQTAGSVTATGDMDFRSSLDLLAVTGGTFSGTPPVMHQGSFALTGGTGVVRTQWGSASLASDVAAGWTVRIEDRSNDTVRLKIPAGATVTNRGTIVFASDSAPGDTNRVHTMLDIGAGATLVNTGTIRADANASPSLQVTIAAAYVSGKNYRDPDAFKQNGTFDVQRTLTAPPFTQSGGTTTVVSGARLEAGYALEPTDPGMVLAAGTIAGNGTVRARKVTNSGGVVAPTPGATPLTFSYNDIYESAVVGGDYIQGPGGTLRTRLSASGSGLVVGGNATLAGTWDVAPALAYTPPVGQTYPVVRTTVNGSRRVGTFGQVTGSYTPTYELDGADVTVPGATASTFSVEDVAVREGETFTFTVRRTTGSGAATVHWSTRDIGSAQRYNDYPDAPGGFPMSGDLAFAAGETVKTVTSIWTLNEGNPEPDESFQFHLSHPTNVPISRATATATILNDDTQLTSVAPNVLGDDGPTTVILRGTGLTSRSTVLLRHGGRPDIAPLSFVVSDDGLTATAVFDASAATPLDGSWYVDARNFGTNGGQQFVTVQHATAAARPFVQASGPAFARGGLASYDYLNYGNLGGAASKPAFLRLSGFPTGADLAVDHLPPGAKASFYEGVAGRTVVVSLGRIAAKANEYIRVRYTPTTTIAGHTRLRLQPALTLSDAYAAPADLRTFSGFTALSPAAGELFAANLAFSGGGAVQVRYAEGTAADTAISHTGTRWTFNAPLTGPAAPKATAAALRDPTGGQLTVDFNGGEFKITGPLIEVEGAYELSVDRRRLTECMKDLKLLQPGEYEELMRFAEGAVVMKGMVNAASLASLGSDVHLQVLDTFASGLWEGRVARGRSGILDNVNGAHGFDAWGQDDEYQLLWLMQLCNPKEKDDVPEPVYKDGQFVPPPFVQELLQSNDPNEKSGSQGGGEAHAVRSDVPLRYIVQFQNKPSASAAAQTVRVVDQLDPAKVDLSTFALGPIAFGDTLLTPPAAARAWTTTVDLRPSMDLLVKVEAGIDGAGKVTWDFTSLDPATGVKTTDAVAGFLPPDVTAPEGQGSVSYAVTPKAGSGTTIGGTASIVFDTNAAIVTNVWSNLIDDDAPTASVASAVPSCAGIAVAWSGVDAASGIGSYDVWASTDGGDWTPWRMRTTETSGVFTGQAGQSYRFDVQARDLAGNLQSADRGDARGAASECTTPPPGGGGETPPVVVGGGGTPPGGTTPPAAKPWLKLGKLPVKLKSGALVVPVSCPASESGGCNGKLTLTAVVKKKTVTLGSASFKVKAGKSASVKVKLSKAALKLLRKGSLKAAAQAKPSAASDKRTASGSVKLRKQR